MRVSLNPARLDMVAAAVDRAASLRPLGVLLVGDSGGGAGSDLETVRQLALAMEAGPFVSCFAAGRECRDATLELALSCDLRVMPPETTVGLSNGYPCDATTVRWLLRALPAAVVAGMLLADQELTGSELARWGGCRLGDASVAEAWCERIAASASNELRLVREALVRARRQTSDEAARMVSDLGWLLAADTHAQQAPSGSRRFPRTGPVPPGA